MGEADRAEYGRLRAAADQDASDAVWDKGLALAPDQALALA
ncbi:MAG TPA: hypothetical protein PKD53_11220 [Chloroflexaceae bacterium]|nr:hypothetical protein [Chloroflexaceae bacterium]